MDNESSHRNQKIKDLVNKDNEILYSVHYQHFTNAIENVLRDIPLITFKNIFKGVYERPEKYEPKNKTRKIKKNYL